MGWERRHPPSAPDHVCRVPIRRWYSRWEIGARWRCGVPRHVEPKPLDTCGVLWEFRFDETAQIDENPHRWVRVDESPRPPGPPPKGPSGISQRPYYGGHLRASQRPPAAGDGE